MIDPLTSAIVGHLVGDYLLQTDWMAQNKKTRTWPCIVHCAVWSVSVCLFAGWGVVALLLLFAAHFAQDRTDVIRWYIRVAKGEGFMQPPLSPWSIIVVDNVWHIVSLWAVARFICA
jgi:hypothetical protein